MLKPTLKFNARKYWLAVEPWSICLWFIAIFLISSSMTRLILVYLNFEELGNSIYLIPVSLGVGLIFDLFIAMCVTLPLVLVMPVLPMHWRSISNIRWIISISGFAFIFGSLYLDAVELFFFEEFSSRFNYVAVDYLIYPHEVFINIWDTYPVLTVLIVTAVFSLFLSWLVSGNTN